MNWLRDFFEDFKNDSVMRWLLAIVAFVILLVVYGLCGGSLETLMVFIIVVAVIGTVIILITGYVVHKLRLRHGSKEARRAAS